MQSTEMALQINTDQRLYVLCNQNGCTTLGFNVAHERAKRMAKWLGVPAPEEALIGTEEGYHAFQILVEMCFEKFQQTKTKCPVELNPQLVGLEGKRVEVEDIDGSRRVFWVGKSQGWIPVHLELERKNSKYGEVVFEFKRVVRVF